MSVNLVHLFGDPNGENTKFFLGFATLNDAWQNCPNGSWMVQLLASTSVTRLYSEMFNQMMIEFREVNNYPGNGEPVKAAIVRKYYPVPPDFTKLKRCDTRD